MLMGTTTMATSCWPDAISPGNATVPDRTHHRRSSCPKPLGIGVIEGPGARLSIASEFAGDADVVAGVAVFPGCSIHPVRRARLMAQSRTGEEHLEVVDQLAGARHIDGGMVGWDAAESEEQD